MKSIRLISAAALGLAMVAPALAQQAGPDAIGVVTSIDGEVIVARGANTYTLGEGDQIFTGDRIVTRADGSVQLSANGCSQSLGSVESIVVDAAFCEKSPIQVANNKPGNVPPQAGGGGVGAVPGIGLAVAAAALAANGGGGNGVENSPIPVSP